MSIARRTLISEGPEGTFESVVACDDAMTGERPGVLVFPNVLGQKESDNVRAERLAALGYVGVAIDIYGQGNRTTRESENPAEFMNGLLGEPELLRARLRHAHETLKALPEVDAARTGAIGFCFGGRCALDLARTGADVRGVASFHGIYKRPPWPNEAIGAKVLILHGWNDPFCPPGDVLAIASEMTEAGADWQLHAYGHTGHAFTDEGIDIPERGLKYSADADRRSWAAMAGFFAEIFA